MVLGLAKVGAQNDRNFIRQGNRAYHKQKWAAAETQYRKAISKNQKNAQAVYNLGCALMMQQKDSMAMIQFENASKLETNKMRRARSYHNMGVVMQQHQQYAHQRPHPCLQVCRRSGRHQLRQHRQLPQRRLCRLHRQHQHCRSDLLGLRRQNHQLHQPRSGNRQLQHCGRHPVIRRPDGYR